MSSSVAVTAAPKCVILGGGQHAQVVIDALVASGTIPYGILDIQAGGRKELLGIPFLGGDELLPMLGKWGVESFSVGIGSTGSTDLRRRLFLKALQHGLKPLVVRHPSAIVARSAVLEPGVQVLAGAIVNPSARIGENSIANTGAIIEHDCQIGAHAHVSPGVRLGGSVIVGDGAHVGLGATVRQGIRIGKNAVVGAGAVVVDDVPEDVLVMGVPARVSRRLAA